MAKPDSVTTIVQSYLAQKADVDKVLQQELDKEKSQQKKVMQIIGQGFKTGILKN